MSFIMEIFAFVTTPSAVVSAPMLAIAGLILWGAVKMAQTGSRDVEFSLSPYRKWTLFFVLALAFLAYGVDLSDRFGAFGPTKSELSRTLEGLQKDSDRWRIIVQGRDGHGGLRGQIADYRKALANAPSASPDGNCPRGAAVCFSGNVSEAKVDCIRANGSNAHALVVHNGPKNLKFYDIQTNSKQPCPH